MNSVELRNKIVQMFEKSHIYDLSDIDWIMVEVLGVSRSAVPFYGEISIMQEKIIMECVEKRLKHIPIAYIFGKTNFYGYDFKVSPDVLIPRMDTEVLVEAVCKHISKCKKPVSVLDIGTGSGVIAITINKETGAKCIGSDISEKAIEIAKENAKELDSDVEFRLSDLFKELSDVKVDIIVSNPPYIETGVIRSLDKEVSGNEPILALDGGDDGLYFYRKIVSESRNHLNENGRIYFEIGFNQSRSVVSLMQEDFEDIAVLKDYGGQDRVVYGKLKKI